MSPNYPRESWNSFQMDVPLCQEKVKKNREKINQKTREAMNNLTRWLTDKWYFTIIALIILLFGESILSSVVVIACLAVAVLISLHKIILPVSLGLELVTFPAIAISVAINPVYGLCFASAAIIISTIIHGKSGTFLFIKIPTYALACFAAATFIPADIINAGIIAAFIGNAIFLSSTFFLNPDRIWSNIPSAVINIIINAWLFSKFGDTLVSVLMT